MSAIDVLTPAGAKSGSVELPAEVFDVQVNVPLIHQVVVAQLAAARQGTHDTKSRGEVRGGGRKPYKQKGTGRARQGSTRAPQFTGGGVVHGPTPRSYDQRTPKKMKAAALRGALSDRARNGRVHVLSSLVEGDVPSTKAAQAALANVTDRPNLLVVLERDDVLGARSVRNLPGVHLLMVDQLNTYDVLCSDDVVFTAGALEVFLAGPTTGKGAKAVATSTEAEALVPAAPAAAEEPVAEATEAEAAAAATGAEAEAGTTEAEAGAEAVAAEAVATETEKEADQ
jgi:large subunit ribosomal protein L4